MKAKEKLVVFGAGGHAKVVIDIIEQQEDYEIAGLLDDDLNLQGQRFFGYPVLGTRAHLAALLSAQLRHAIVAIGDNADRATVQRSCASSAGASPARYTRAPASAAA